MMADAEGQKQRAPIFRTPRQCRLSAEYHLASDCLATQSVVTCYLRYRGFELRKYTSWSASRIRS